MGDNSSAECQPATTTTRMIKNAHWAVEYARFFNFPSSSSSSSCPFLRPMPSSKKNRVKGTWLPSTSSNVSLHILFFSHAFSQPPTLVVSLQDRIYEEHYISKLNFTWPKGSDSSGCAFRESRVIFVCYQDGMSQIQKFALRFSSSTESQKFMKSLQRLKEGRDFSSDFPHCVSTEGIAEEREQLQRPSINQEHGPYSCHELAIHQGHAVGGTDVALPESFTALLVDCCTETELGVSQLPTEVDLNRFFKEKKGADKFIDMVDLMDTVIIGMGGNLAF